MGRAAACVALALASLGAAAAEPTPRAVIVGVGQYADPALVDLEGPPHDARAMRALLVERFGFSPAGVTLLIDGQATRGAILGALARAAAESRAGDPLVFYFSGHGARTLDGSGDEPDGWDEGLVPHDSGRADRPNLDLIDDELHGVLRGMVGRGAQVTFIYDACHSGTGTRDPLARIAPRDRRFRMISAPATLQPDDLPEGWTLIAAARQDQLAFEKPLGPGGLRRGLLTWTLIEALRTAPEGASLRDVFESARAAVRQRDPRQDPQLEGPGADRAPFGVERRPAARYVGAGPAAGGAVIDAGAAHGVRPGAVYAIGPPGVAEPPADAPIGRVVEVGATTARVELDRGGPIAPASRAFLRSAGPPDARIPVYIEPDPGWALAEPLRAALEAHPAVLVVPRRSRSAARLVVRGVGGQIRFEGIDGRRLDTMPAAGVGDSDDRDHSDATGRVMARLMPWIRWYAIDQLRGGDALAVTFSEADRRLRGGVVHAKAGDRLTLTVSNDSSVDLYLTVLALGADGSIAVVYPLPGARAYIAAFGSWHQPVEAAVPAGVDRAIDRLKLIVTSQPTDFRFLQQGPASQAAGAKGASMAGLDALWAAAGFGASAKGLTSGRWTSRDLVIETTR